MQDFWRVILQSILDFIFTKIIHFMLEENSKLNSINECWSTKCGVNFNYVENEEILRRTQIRLCSRIGIKTLMKNVKAF